MNNEQNCIFCQIVQGKKNGYVIYEDQNHLAFLDKYPIDMGHALMIPKKHYQRITDMNHETKEVGTMFGLVPKIASAILKTTGAVAFSLAQNNGVEAKQIIPHVHVHIIPRYKDRGTVWTKREIADDGQLSALAQQIKSNVL